VSGERRLRAIRWGAVHDPDNPQFAALPAVICPGPLSASERRIWQLVENVARQDLQPGELAAALLLERCAIATSKLLAAGRPVPADVPAMEDPVGQWRALEKLRGQDTDCAAPWIEVLRRLGLQLKPRKARQLVQAFAALPHDISEEMDAAKVALHTRITFVKLRQGREAAAEEIWAAVKQRGRSDLLPAAIQTCLERPALNAKDALEAAESLHAAANLARSHKLSKTATVADGPVSNPALEVNQEVVAGALNALHELLSGLRAGKVLRPYDQGSVRLALVELRTFVEPEVLRGAAPDSPGAVPAEELRVTAGQQGNLTA
jgi:ParB family transcriptional regulator, chromosome partitioning protein